MLRRESLTASRAQLGLGPEPESPSPSPRARARARTPSFCTVRVHPGYGDAAPILCADRRLACGSRLLGCTRPGGGLLSVLLSTAPHARWTAPHAALALFIWPSVNDSGALDAPDATGLSPRARARAREPPSPSPRARARALGRRARETLKFERRAWGAAYRPMRKLRFTKCADGVPVTFRAAQARRQVQFVCEHAADLPMPTTMGVGGVYTASLKMTMLRRSRMAGFPYYFYGNPFQIFKAGRPAGALGAQLCAEAPSRNEQRR